MNPLLYAEMSDHRNADVARGVRRHRAAAKSGRSTARPTGGRRLQRMFAVLRPARQASC